MSLESQHPEYQSSARSSSKFATLLSTKIFIPNKLTRSGRVGRGGVEKRLLYASDGTWCTFGLLVSLR